MNLEAEELLLICEKIKTGEENNIRTSYEYLSRFVPTSKYKTVGKILKKHACFIDTKLSNGYREGMVDIYIGLNTKLRLYHNLSTYKFRGCCVIENDTTVVVDGVDSDTEELRWRRFVGYDRDGFARCVELKRYKIKVE